MLELLQFASRPCHRLPQIGTGVMVGLPGQSLRDLAGDIMFFRDLGADMIGMVGWRWRCAACLPRLQPLCRSSAGIKAVVCTHRASGAAAVTVPACPAYDMPPCTSLRLCARPPAPQKPAPGRLDEPAP